MAIRALAAKRIVAAKTSRKVVVCQAKLGQNVSAGVASVMAATMLVAPPAFSQLEVSAAASQSYQEEMQALIQSRTGKQLPEVEAPVQAIETAPLILTEDEDFTAPARMTRQQMLAAVRAEAEQEAGVAKAAAPAASPAILAGVGILAVLGLAAAGLQNGQQEEQQQADANAAAASAATAIPPLSEQPESGTGPVAMA